MSELTKERLTEVLNYDQQTSPQEAHAAYAVAAKALFGEFARLV